MSMKNKRHEYRMRVKINIKSSKSTEIHKTAETTSGNSYGEVKEYNILIWNMFYSHNQSNRIQCYLPKVYIPVC